MTEGILVSASLLLTFYTGLFFRSSPDQDRSARFVGLNSVLFPFLFKSGPLAIIQKMDQDLFNGISDFFAAVGGSVLLHWAVFSIAIFVNLVVTGHFTSLLRLTRQRLHALSFDKQLKIAGLSILVFGFSIGMFAPSKPKRARDVSTVSGFALNAEEKNQVEFDFNLARNLYVQGKYELCLSQIIKVKERVIVYKNSQELQTFCEQGRELVKRQRALETLERQVATVPTAAVPIPPPPPQFDAPPPPPPPPSDTPSAQQAQPAIPKSPKIIRSKLRKSR